MAAFRGSHEPRAYAGGIIDVRQWWTKFCACGHGTRGIDDDLAPRSSAQLEFETEANLARGMPPDEARAAARRRSGNLTAIQERARDAWTFPRLESLAQDVRYGLRGMRRSAGFSLVVILTFALGASAPTRPSSAW